MASARWLAMVAICAATLSGQASGRQALELAQVDKADLSKSNMVRKNSEAIKARDEHASQCMAMDASVPKTGNGVVDMRCSLVAFEVCMNQKTGIISQSQESRQHCTVLKGIGGAGACKAPCEAVATLPVGGEGVVARYKGLTPAAVACYDERITAAGKARTASAKACGVNEAVTACLYNGSSSRSVNAAILREAKAGCASFKSRYPKEICPACTNWQLNHSN